MEVKIYDVLPKYAIDIRKSVFMEEQGFMNEFDEIDDRAEHLVMFDNGFPVAACRIFWDEKLQSYVLGRLSVIKAYRGQMLGAKMIQKAEEHVRASGGKRIALHAQCRVSEFYRKQGFAARGEIEDDEGCPHVWMYKEWN